VLIIRRISCINIPSSICHSVSVTVSCAGRKETFRRTVQPFTESDDTRCCDNTICPPEDGHVNARNMSRIVM
jgi:hypothetical protein